MALGLGTAVKIYIFAQRVLTAGNYLGYVGERIASSPLTQSLNPRKCFHHGSQNCDKISNRTLHLKIQTRTIGWHDDVGSTVPTVKGTYKAGQANQLANHEQIANRFTFNLAVDFPKIFRACTPSSSREFQSTPTAKS